MAKVSSVPVRNRLKTLPTFQLKCSALLHGEGGNWSRTPSTYTYTHLPVCVMWLQGLHVPDNKLLTLPECIMCQAFVSVVMFAPCRLYGFKIHPLAYQIQLQAAMTSRSASSSRRPGKTGKWTAFLFYLTCMIITLWSIRTLVMYAFVIWLRNLRSWKWLTEEICSGGIAENGINGHVHCKLKELAAVGMTLLKHVN